MSRGKKSIVKGTTKKPVASSAAKKYVFTFNLLCISIYYILKRGKAPTVQVSPKKKTIAIEDDSEDSDGIVAAPVSPKKYVTYLKYGILTIH